MAIKLGRMVAHLDELLHIKSHENHYICFIAVPMATEHGKMVTYLEGILTIKSHEALIRVT